MRAKTFDQLVKQAADVNSREDVDALYGDVSFSFQHDKISWCREETLIKLLEVLYKAFPEK